MLLDFHAFTTKTFSATNILPYYVIWRGSPEIMPLVSSVSWQGFEHCIPLLRPMTWKTGTLTLTAMQPVVVLRMYVSGQSGTIYAGFRKLSLLLEMRGANQLETRLKEDGFYEEVKFRPSYDQVNRKTGVKIPGAVPLQAADLFAYQLFDLARTIEKRGSLPDDSSRAVWSIIDKIPGEPQITSDENLAGFNDRIELLSGASAY